MAILCMESGGTKLVAALADSDARLVRVEKAYRRAGQRGGETLNQLIAMGRNLVGKDVRIEGLGFGFGGIVRRSSGQPYTCFHEEGWEQLDSAGLLRKAFGVPVFVENDCNLAALAEAHRGAGSAKGTLFYVTLGTGIGGAVVREGRLLELGEFGEGELGHIIVDEEGPRCPCGNRGCLETLCSGPGLARLAQRLLDRSVDAPSLLEGFRAGAEESRRVIEQAAVYLGRVLGSVVNLLNPERVVLGGGLMQSGPAFLEAIARQAERYTFPLFRRPERYVRSRLQEHAVCQGAALYVYQRNFSDL